MQPEMDPISCNSRSLRFSDLLGPTGPDDIQLLQEYVESNGSAEYLPSSSVKSLISLWNYMNLLIKKGKSTEQK